MVCMRCHWILTLSIDVNQMWILQPRTKHLKVLRKVWIYHRWRILQILEIHYIVDPVNTFKYWRHTHYVESFYTRNGQYITWSLALFDRIKSELTIDKKKTSTYIHRIKNSPDNKICSITHWYIGVTMVTLVIMSIIQGNIPIVVVYLKKINVRILENKTFGLKKQEHEYNNKLKLCN
jgi:hypothetical protein